MTVPAEEFIRRFLQHTLPPGFQRIRYYGFLANCHRGEKLKVCRHWLAAPDSDLLPQAAAAGHLGTALSSPPLRLCPQCGIGILSRLLVLPPWHSPLPRLDTS